MRVFIHNSTKFEKTMIRLCDEAGLTYGAASAAIVQDLAKDCEISLAIIPADLKPGAKFEIANGHAVISMKRVSGGFELTGLTSSKIFRNELKKHLTILQKIYMKKVDDALMDLRLAG